MGITYSKYWNDPRYQKSLLRLTSQTAMGSGQYIKGQPYSAQKPSFDALHEDLVGEFAHDDLKTKLKFRQGQQSHRRAMHGLDVQSRGLDIDKYRAKTTRKLADKRYETAERAYWPTIGLGVGSVLMNKYLEDKENERAAQRQAKDTAYKERLLGLLGGK